MAPLKDGKKNGARNITNFFAPFVRRAPPPTQHNNNNDTDDVIVVAQPKTTQSPRRLPTSSQSSLPTSQRRGRGRPRKKESQQVRDDQLRSSPISTTTKRYNLNPLDRKLDVTPTKDSPYRSASDSSGKKRIAAGVQLPSPRISSARNDNAAKEGEMRNTPSKKVPARSGTADMPVTILDDERINQTAPTASVPSPRSSVPAIVYHPREPTAPPASYSSISTLTTLSASSGATATPNPLNSSTSSRRITQNGLQGVTNSDSEDGSSDGESPFMSLSSFCQPKKRKLSNEASNTPPAKTLKSNEKEKSRNFFKPYVSPPRKTYKNTLKSLVAQHEKWQESEAMIASMESAVQDAAKREERAKLVDDDLLDTGALVDAAGSDLEDRERMLMALERTEALREKDHYRFFVDDKPTWSNAPFPVDSLPAEPWTSIYRNDDARQQACITGFAAYMAATNPLPMAVTGWMVAQLMYEQDEVLCEAYVEILRASSIHPASISDTTSSLNSIYKTKSFFEHDRIEPVRRTGLPRGLKYIMRVAQFCAPMTDSIVPEAIPAQTCAAFLDMALINIDERVKTDLELSLTVAKSIEELLDALPEDSFLKLIPDATGMMCGPSELSTKERYQAISSLPASTARANRLRRRLALECFSTAEDRKDSDAQDWPGSILQTLVSNPLFNISEETDYNMLQGITVVLDIAISAGWTPYSQIVPGAPVGRFGKLPEPSEAGKQHNLQIDRIVKRLTSTMAKIKDAGTSHLGRVEAKVAIERLVRRLQYQVRSRVKPSKSVFSESRNQARLDGFSKSILLKERTRPSPPKARVSFNDQVEIMPQEKSSARKPSSEEDESFQTAVMDMEDEESVKGVEDSAIFMRSSPPI